MINTGFHWSSPINHADSVVSAGLLQSSGRWGSVFILPPGQQGSPQPDFLDGIQQAYNAVRAVGGPDLRQCVARIYHPSAVSFSSWTDADNWLRANGYYDSLNAFINLGGRYVVPFNELNVSGEPQYNIDAASMNNIGFALRNAFWNGGARLQFVLFPGPSGLLGFSGGGGFPYDWQGYYTKYGLALGNYDGQAGHCYARTPTQFASGGPTNPALEYLSWWHNYSSLPNWITEAGCFGGATAAAGTALADFEWNVGALNAGSFGGAVQIVNGYILDQSDSGATSNGQSEINSTVMSAYNAERQHLGF